MVKIGKNKKSVKGFSQENPRRSIVVSGRLKTIEPHRRSSLKDTVDASQVRSQSCGQSRREKLPLVLQEAKESGKVTSRFIPVISKTGKAMMPCHPARARELIEKGKAVRRFKTGMFYLLLTEREDGEVQDVAVGIDSGSKREAFTIKSARHTFVNVLSDAVTWVKDSVEVRRNMRRARRFRKTPCRKNRENRSRGGIPPSTKARWQTKLRIVNILRKLYPIKVYVVEDIQAKTTKNGKKWNISFSPLQIGKGWFYGELEKLGQLVLKKGFETKELRDSLGLKKTKGKMDEVFSAHNLDSWVLANSFTGGHVKPDYDRIFRLIPLQFHRRQLHAFQPVSGNIRRNYGGTVSGKFKRGSLVSHKKYGVCYMGGIMEKLGMSLHDVKSGKRLCQNAGEKDLMVLNYNYFRWYDSKTA